MTENIYKQQKEFFNTGQTRSYDFRAEQLRKLGQIVEDGTNDIIKALYDDLKRPAYEAYSSEIALVLAEIRHVLKNLHRWIKPDRVKTPLLGFPGRSYIIYRPYGVCGVFAPWNYPFQLALNPLVGAIAAGNCAILKPSEMSPSSSKIITRLINDNFDPSFIMACPGGKKESQSLLQAPLDFIFFTGSTRVGSIVMHHAARNLTPVVLELGGKSPCIITEDVPLDITVRRILWGKFLNAGQTCIAPDYVLLPPSLVDGFLKTSRRVIREFYGPDPRKSSGYSRIINPDHLERLEELSSGANCVIGGNIDKKDLYIAPSIFYPVQWSEPLMQEEIFGPLLPVVTYETLDEIIDTLQDKPSPLALYIFSGSKQIIQKLSEEVNAGSLCINDVILHVSSPYLPFGGVGSSGMGKYHGKYSFTTFSHSQSVMKRHFRPDFSFRYPPNTMGMKRLKKLLRFLF